MHTGVTDDERVAKTMDKLSVNFGVEILTLVKGYVSTEVDARLSFDTEATLERAHNIIALYEAAGEKRARQTVTLVGGRGQRVRRGGLHNKTGAVKYVPRGFEKDGETERERVTTKG